MQESGSSMRPSHHLGEVSIKVPAPFAGISDLGFTAQYRAQTFNERLRDVPLLFEGPGSPMRKLAESLLLLSASHADGYTWSAPVMLSDEVVVLAFRDRSVETESLSDGARIADYILNLVRPVVFTFLHDCAAVAHLKLSDVIDMRVAADRNAIADFSLPLPEIVQPNGERLLWGLA
jgi:hypothetical protein